MDLRVAFDNIIFGLQKQGGISNYWMELLRRAPVDSIVLTHHQDLQNTCWRELVHKFTDVKQRSIATSLDRYLPVFRLPTSATIYHSSYYRTPMRNIVTVQTVYDFVYERYRTGLARSIHSFQKARAIEQADQICCISHSTRNDLLNHFGAKFESITHVTHLAASDIYRVIPAARSVLIDSAKYQFLRSERPVLLFVGARRPNPSVAHKKSYKRFDLAVSALKELPDYDLVVIGGEPWGIDDQELVELLKISNQVYPVGILPQDELPLWYNSAHALLYLSDYEGFGLPVLEAAQCLCPVIAQNSSSIPEVHGFKDFLINNVCVESIVEKVKLLENDFKKKEIVQASYEHSQLFSWDNTWRVTQDVYAKTV
jgi:glycosyltransferase involved in cell wall biosynthesis